MASRATQLAAAVESMVLCWWWCCVCCWCLLAFPLLFKSLGAAPSRSQAVSEILSLDLGYITRRELIELYGLQQKRTLYLRHGQGKANPHIKRCLLGRACSQADGLLHLG